MNINENKSSQKLWDMAENLFWGNCSSFIRKQKNAENNISIQLKELGKNQID